MAERTVEQERADVVAFMRARLDAASPRRLAEVRRDILGRLELTPGCPRERLSWPRNAPADVDEVLVGLVDEGLVDVEGGAHSLSERGRQALESAKLVELELSGELADSLAEGEAEPEADPDGIRF
jgi:hypothetical protein